MDQKLSLIKTDYQDVEKRVFPRFPFSFLTFKGKEDHVFEVKDISMTGMQLSLKDGGHTYRQEDQVTGELHWKGASLAIIGRVMWVQGSRLGVEFNINDTFDGEIKNFLSIDNIISGMRPVHRNSMDLELPSNLKYWLQADGPVEVFVWRHNDGEVARFQVIMLDNFIEYEDGKGLKSGQVLTKRDLDTPLVKEDEFLFQIDQVLDEDKLSFAQQIVSKLPEGFLPEEAKEFLQVKLGMI